MEKSLDKEYTYNLAKSWIIKAGENLRESILDQVIVEYKTSAADLVTEKDKEIENYFIKQIKNKFPNHFVLGEEGQANNEFSPKEEIVWIIDPIDGTTNFVHQKRNYAISVALYDHGEPVFGLVYDPTLDELFHAFVGNGAYLNDKNLKKLEPTSLEESVISVNPMWLTPNQKINYVLFQPIVEKVRGIRYIGSAALEMAYVACGRLDAYLDFRLSSWDIAAGIIILNEVDALNTTVTNAPVDVFANSTNFVSKPKLHDEIISFLGKTSS